jgi:hypothetical protein
MKREQQLEASLLVLEKGVKLRRGKWEHCTLAPGMTQLCGTVLGRVLLLPKFN